MNSRAIGRPLDYRSVSWSDAFPVVSIGCRERPIALLAPNSYLGTIYVPLILQKCRRVVAMVDDQSDAESILGIPRWSSDQFRRRASGVHDLLAIDLTASPLGNAVFAYLLEETGVPRADLVEILAELELPAVYQTPKQMRELTIGRQAEWSALRDSFDDETSRRSLDAILLLRLTFDRRYLRPIVIAPEEEYFSVYSGNSTFSLGSNEVFCDGGAYIGSTVRKVIAATGGCFRSIHAFEPDRSNFASLESLRALRIDALTLHNSALGDFSGRVTFHETGTMGSHVAESGAAGDAAITRLDDAIEDVTFIKMDLEGFERRALRGAAGLIGNCRPRMAVTGYHYANDLLDICGEIRRIAPDYVLRLRHHSSYFYDSIVYAEPRHKRSSEMVH